MIEYIRELEIVARKLETGASGRREILGMAKAYIDRFIRSLPQMPGYRKGAVTRVDKLEMGEEGKSMEQLLGILEEEVDMLGINPASGGHMGYIPGGGVWTSSVADMLAAVANRYAGIRFASPGAVEIENQMINWMRDIFGYPPESHGNLTSGGSIANLIAVNVARDAHGINSTNVRQSVIYYSEQVHHCLHKAFRTTGLYEAVQRSIPLNNKYQMDADLLAAQVKKDSEAGLTPFLIVASAGTTDTGAIDPLDNIADISEQHGIWFHVDAAYGGFFMLLDAMKEKFQGIERSDSVVVDPHKTLFLPYGSGAVLVRDRKALIQSYTQNAAYMIDAYEDEAINPADTGPELTRHFRGLRMWLPLHLHGLTPFKANLEEKLFLSQYFHREVGKLGFQTGPEPELTVSIFRYPGDEDNMINRKLIEAIHADGRIFLSSTIIKDQLWIRCAIVCFRSHLREVDMALEMIRECREKVTG